MAYKIFLRTAAFPKADVENIGVGIALDGCFWPLAARKGSDLDDV